MALVVFDVGEVLVDDTRLWLRHADRLGVPPFTFLAVLGALIGAGRDHREVFDVFDGDAAPSPRSTAGRSDADDAPLPGDLYPDVVPTLDRLVRAGHRLAVAANQPAGTAAALARLRLPVEVLVLSGPDGVAKPEPAFFRLLLERARHPASDAVYVGDRLDDDIIPARAVGMAAVLIRRGPWGILHARRPEAAQATAVISSLAELPAALGAAAR